ncbi:bifunctional transcriptional activator/DNA repair enzyme AdaA [Candidatus Riflebacteria bacterium]
MESWLPDEKTMYNALLKKNPEFEGIFFVAVKSTGIFCRLTCTARKPKKENVKFFSSIREVILNGYRPCKVCQPMEEEGVFPGWLQPVFRHLQATPEFRLKDAALIKLGLEPNRVRRWFKKKFGMTFQAYLRLLRVSGAFEKLQSGRSVIETAFASGYESLSGFCHAFKKNTGSSPKNFSTKKPVKLCRILSPLGPLLAGATQGGICLLEFMDRRMLPGQLQNLKHSLKSEILPGDSVHFEPLEKQLIEYFTGERQEFTLPLDQVGTPFQLSAWRALQQIPYGKTHSYKEQATLIGQPNAVRAVGAANGRNKISIIIPCHRVIGSNNKLVGYGGGLWRKRYLLNLEQSVLASEESK